MSSVSTGPAPCPEWTRRHLLGLEDLSAAEIIAILDRADEFRRLFESGQTKLDLLAGTVVGHPGAIIPIDAMPSALARRRDC